MTDDDVRSIVRDEIANVILLCVACMAAGWVGAMIVL